MNAEGRTTLEVDGALASPDETADWAKPRTFSPMLSIVGMLDTAGDYVRLKDVERVDFKVAGDSPQQQSFLAKTCIKRNSDFPSDHDREDYSELRIDLKGLEEWLKLDSLRAEKDYGSANGQRELVSYTDHLFEFSIDDGTVTIECFTSGGNFFGLFGDYARRKITYEQSFTIVYRPALVSSLAHLQYVFTKIEELLSLFIGSYYRLNRPHFVRKEELFDRWDTIFTYGDTPSTEKLNQLFFLVPFAEVRDQFGPLLQTWLKKSEAFGAGFYLYTASFRHQQTYSEDRLFTLAAGIETLHRKSLDRNPSESSQHDRNRAERLLALIPADDPDKRWLVRKLAHAHEPALEQRLLECLRELPLRFRRSEVEKFVKRCASRRNDISHRGGPPTGTDYEVFHKEITHLAEALGYLFHLIILYRVGLSEEAVLRAATKGWFAKRVIEPSLEAVDLHLISVPPEKAC